MVTSWRCAAWGLHSLLAFGTSVFQIKSYKSSAFARTFITGRAGPAQRADFVRVGSIMDRLQELMQSGQNVVIDDLFGPLIINLSGMSTRDPAPSQPGPLSDKPL